jgi:hypothetical protein
MPKPDMTLAVNLQVTGTIDNNGVLTATPTYSQGATNPPSTGVVDSSGNINLNNMTDPGNDYSNQTDITFMLSGTATDQEGNSYALQFPSTVDKAVTILQQGRGGNGELSPTLNSGTSLLIDDADEDGASYHYCITVEADVITAGSQPTCQLDPQIVNR